MWSYKNKWQTKIIISYNTIVPVAIKLGRIVTLTFDHEVLQGHVTN